MSVMPLVVIQRHTRSDDDNLHPNLVAFFQEDCRLESQLTLLAFDAICLVHEAPAHLISVQEETDSEAEKRRTLREIRHARE